MRLLAGSPRKTSYSHVIPPRPRGRTRPVTDFEVRDVRLPLYVDEDGAATLEIVRQSQPAVGPPTKSPGYAPGKMNSAAITVLSHSRPADGNYCPVLGLNCRGDSGTPARTTAFLPTPTSGTQI
jgi:hypothetical protein